MLRNHPSVDSVTVQDHGGNWWRHGSLNADRDWDLEKTSLMLSGMREDAMRSKKEKEPIRCPQCARILMGFSCPCGYTVSASRKSRPVVMANGELKQMTGDVFKPRRLSKRPDGPQLWEKMWHRSRTKTGARTFRAAAALFAMENQCGYPDPSWPKMPVDPRDWYRLVGDVPAHKLR